MPPVVKIKGMFLIRGGLTSGVLDDRLIRCPRQAILQVMNERIKGGKRERQPYADKVSWLLPRAPKHKPRGALLDSEGRRWHELKRKMYGPGQELLSKMLKGIVSVPDVRHVQSGDAQDIVSAESAQRLQYFSSDVRNTTRSRAEKVKADMFVLKWIFKESDRESDHNVVQGGPKKTVQIDFEFFSIFFLDPNVYTRNGPRSDAFYRARLGGHEPEHMPPAEMFDKEELRHLTIRQEQEVERIIDELVARFGNEEGKKSLEGIVNSLKVPMREVLYFPFPENQSNEESFELFYRTFLDRLHAADKILRDNKER